MRAVHSAERAGLPVGSVTVERLEDRVVREIREISHDEPDRADDAWDLLLRESESQEGSTLVDFVWSLACEQRDDLRDTSVSEDVAGDAFGALAQNHMEAVSAFVLSRLPAIGPEGAMDVTVEALARAFEAYWSRDAKRAYRPGARIRTLICTIAHREAVRALKSSGREIELDPIAHDRAADDGAGSDGFRSALARAMEECLDELPPKRQLVATRRWRDDEKPSEIADSLGMGRPAVSNHLNKAKPALQTCLQSKGITWEAEA